MTYDIRSISFEHFAKLEKKYLKVKSPFNGLLVMKVCRFPKGRPANDNKAYDLLNFLTNIENLNYEETEHGELDFNFHKEGSYYYLSNVRRDDGTLEKVVFLLIYAEIINQDTINSLRNSHQVKDVPNGTTAKR